jgi:hypothetical protein
MVIEAGAAETRAVPKKAKATAIAQKPSIRALMGLFLSLDVSESGSALRRLVANDGARTRRGWCWRWVS